MGKKQQTDTLTTHFTRPFLIRVPDQLFRPIKEKDGTVSGFQIDFREPNEDGVLGAFLKLTGQRKALFGVDLEPMSAKEGIAAVEALYASMRAGTFGKRDVRDVISGRGNVAGKGGKGNDKPPKSKEEQELETLQKQEIAKAAAKKEVEKILDKIGPINFTGSDPKKRPVDDQTGGKLTPAQLLRIEIAISNFIGPEVNPGLEGPSKGKGRGSSKKPLPGKLDSLINPGSDGNDSKKIRITAKPIPNNGYTDPQRYRLFRG